MSEQKSMYVQLCDCFAGGSWGELDYIREGRNQELFRHELGKRGVKVKVRLGERVGWGRGWVGAFTLKRSIAEVR